MPIFKITAKYTVVCTAEVEAKDHTDAISKAEQMDGGDFTQSEDKFDDGDWHICSAELSDCQYTDQQELKDREDRHES